MIFKTREEWLEALISKLSLKFAVLGHPIPAHVRVTCGFTSGGTRRKAGKSQTGEVWDASRSGDAAYEIMVSPIIDDTRLVAVNVCDSLCHAASGDVRLHNAAFEVLARGLKLEGALPDLKGGNDFAVFIQPILDDLGAYPHSRLNTDTRPTQTTRMIKCVCPTGKCDGRIGTAGTKAYSVRISQKWLSISAPLCPVHNVRLVIE